MKRAGFQREGLTPHVVEEFARDEEPDRGEDEADHEDHANVVGFPDVYKDFLRVDEVIDGDGVEAGFEFFEEEEFYEKQENLDVAGDENCAEKNHAVEAGGEQALGNDQEPEEQGKSENQCREEVALEAVE